MKRFFLAAVAASMLIAPAAQADTRQFRPGIEHGQKYSGPSRSDNSKTFRKAAPAQHWTRGKRMPDWRKKQAVRDHYRHGLRKPGRDQRWVRVGNDYLLIGITSGIIASIIAGR